MWDSFGDWTSYEEGNANSFWATRHSKFPQICNEETYGREENTGKDDTYGREQNTGKDETYGREQITGTDGTYGSEHSIGKDGTYRREENTGKDETYRREENTGKDKASLRLKRKGRKLTAALRNFTVTDFTEDRIDSYGNELGKIAEMRDIFIGEVEDFLEDFEKEISFTEVLVWNDSIRNLR